VSAATSHAPAAAAAPREFAPFKGGGPWLGAGGGIGLLLLILTFVGMAMNPRDAGYSYLMAFAYWAGISFASVILLMIFHATHARWVTVLRRPVEAMSSSITIFLLLFIPVIIAMKNVYIWIDPPESLGHEALKLIHGKVAYLNKTAFIVRTMVIYFPLAIFVAWRLAGLSKKQDASNDPQLLQKQRNLAAGGLPFIGLAMTFAAFDWLMSLNPTWFSTVFGVYYFAGSLVTALSLLAIATKKGRSANFFAGLMNDEHTHNIGKLMLAFICFWTYIAFSQLMLIWIAGIPEETPFYITRFSAGWAAPGILLIIGHFFFPFFALLSRSLKRNPKQLGYIATWIVFIHAVDVFWLVMPSRDPEGIAFRWTDFTAFFGVGLVAIAFGVSRLRGKLPVPAKDPYLAESIRYRQP
jgi:hypothetical protein